MRWWKKKKKKKNWTSLPLPENTDVHLRKKNESFSDDMHSKIHSLYWGYDLPISRPRCRTTVHDVSVIEILLMAFWHSADDKRVFDHLIPRLVPRFPSRKRVGLRVGLRLADYFADTRQRPSLQLWSKVILHYTFEYYSHLPRCSWWSLGNCCPRPCGSFRWRGKGLSWPTCPPFQACCRGQMVFATPPTALIRTLLRRYTAPERVKSVLAARWMARATKH
jgi:hypothetical protein